MLCNEGQTKSPVEAWERATIGIFGEGTSGQKKGCPRGTFLGLCEEGRVKGIARGKYTRSKKNKRYGIHAIDLLQESPSLANNISALWGKVLKDEVRKHNSQMDVVVSLWKKGLIL